MTDTFEHEPMLVLVPRVRPVVELGVGDSYTPTGIGQWGVSRWGQATATWVGIEPLWVDISCYVQDVKTFCGHERSIDRWEIGTAEVVVKNETGWADYPPTDPDAFPLLTVRPGRQVRIGVYIDGATDPVWLWRGYTDEATPNYDPIAGATVTLSCIDAKGEVGRAMIAKRDTPIGASEVVTNRITRILDAANWSIYRRSMQTSGITLQATVLGGKATDLMDIAADSAGASVFGDMNGRICFRNRDWQMYPTGTLVDGTIGNGGDPGSPFSDGYLTPTVSGAFTPDPGPLPAEFVFIMKLRGPTSGSDVIASQWPSVYTDPANSWYLYRTAATGELGFLTTTDGINVATSQVLSTNTPTGADEYLALAVDLNNGSSQRVVTAYTSSDLGNNWTLTDTDSAATTAIYDGVGDLEIGSLWNGNGLLFDSRIYWIELQEGLIPNGGDMIWRFDANDAYGSASFWTDPQAREWHVNDADAITDTVNAVLAEVCPNAWETTFARADMATRVHIARASDDAPIAASDNPNIALYGVETYDRLDLETELDIYLSSLANRHLEVRNASTLPRIRSVTLDASRDGVVDLLAIADPRNAPRFRCRHTQGDRTVFDKEMFAVAIEHTMNADTWTARISLDDAAAYATVGGTWGSARWQRSLWAS